MNCFGRHKKRYAAAALLLVLLAVPMESGAALEQGDPRIAYVDLDRPTVIVFLPPSMRGAANVEATAAEAQVKAALESAMACLGEDFASYQMLFADRVVVRSPGREESFELAYFAPLVGALLIRPGSSARILFAGGGPEALERLLRSAVSRFFDKECDN